MNRISNHWGMMRLWGFLALISFMGCASPPVAPVKQNLSAVENAILRAEDSGAETHAPLELKLAREKLEKARKSLSNEEYDEATRLAEEAMADATLAGAMSEAAKAKKELKEEEKDLNLLQNEINRKKTTD